MSAAQADDQTFGQKAGAALETAKDKTIEAGQTVIDTSKNTAATIIDAGKNTATTVVDAVTPDAAARRVDVTLTNRRIEMPERMEAGRKAFVVTNRGSMRRNFEITGEGIDRKFVGAVDPKETKTLHVALKPGSYEIASPTNGRRGDETHAKLWVK